MEAQTEAVHVGEIPREVWRRGGIGQVGQISCVVSVTRRRKRC